MNGSYASEFYRNQPEGVNEYVYKYSNNSKYFIEGKYNYSLAKQIFFKKRYDLIPVLSEDKIVKRVLLWHLFFGKRKKTDKKLNIKVVIMAGGKGTRLDPLTKILPKPLVPIKDKPIIEHITSRFIKYGMNDFYFTIKYKMKIILRDMIFCSSYLTRLM